MCFTFNVNAQIGSGYNPEIKETYQGVTQWYKSPQTVETKIWYFGRPQTIKIKYDLICQCLVTPYQGEQMQLLYEQVDSFILYGSKFVKNDHVSKTHFLEVVYKGPVYTLYVERSKHLYPTKFVDGAFYDVIDSSTVYYISSNNKSRSFKNIKQLCKMLDIEKIKGGGTVEDMIEAVKFKEKVDNLFIKHISKTS